MLKKLRKKRTSRRNGYFVQAVAETQIMIRTEKCPLNLATWRKLVALARAIWSSVESRKQTEVICIVN